MNPAVFALLPLLSAVVIVVAIVYGVSRWRRAGTGADSGEPIAVSVRRFYFYSVSLTGLLVGASGLVFIVHFALEGIFGALVMAASRDPLAIGLSLAVVGLAVWGFHWRHIQQSIKARKSEAQALLRSFYIYLVLAIAGVILLTAGYATLRWLLAFDHSEVFDAAPVAFALIWGPIWAYHWRTGSAGAPADAAVAVRRIYIYGACTVALAMGATGIGMAIFVVLRSGYAAVFGDPAIAQAESALWGETMVTGLALSISGAVAWWAHFRRFGAGAPDSTLRQAYLFAAALLGGYLVAIVAAIAVTRLILIWLIGVPQNPALIHFEPLPNWIATLAIGIAVWAYHRAVLRRESVTSPLGPMSGKRVYTYVLAVFGLAILAGAVSITISHLAANLLETHEGILTGAGSQRNSIATAISLAAVGAPVWLRYWRSAQARVNTDGDRERSALARRVFVFTVLGAGALVLIGSLSFLLYALLSDWLEGEFGIAFLYQGRYALGAIAATLPLVLYYWNIHQQDRASEPAKERVMRRTVAVLSGPGGEQFIADLEQILGYRVEAFDWIDSEGPVQSMDLGEVKAVAAGVSAAPGSKVLVTLDVIGARILSYDP